jgi:hypothetical protein
VKHLIGPRYLGLIAAAAVALVAITATAAAASQAGGFLPTTNFIGSSSGGRFVFAGGAEIKCNAMSILSGTMETDSHGTIDIHYEGCVTVPFTLTTLGDKSGVLLVPSLWLLCLIEPKTLAWGLWIEPDTPVHIEGFAGLKSLKGGVIARIIGNAKSLKKTLEFNQSGGFSTPNTCTGMDGKVKTANLSIQEDASKESNSLAFEGKATIESETKKTEVEIMDGF